jgi:flagellar biosynthesis protein FliR
MELELRRQARSLHEHCIFTASVQGHQAVPVNLKTALGLCITIAESILLRADEVIR